MSGRRDISWRHLREIYAELYHRSWLVPAFVQFYVLGQIPSRDPVPLTRRRKLLAAAWVSVWLGVFAATAALYPQGVLGI